MSAGRHFTVGSFRLLRAHARVLVLAALAAGCGDAVMPEKPVAPRAGATVKMARASGQSGPLCRSGGGPPTEPRSSRRTGEVTRWRKPQSSWGVIPSRLRSGSASWGGLNLARPTRPSDRLYSADAWAR